MSNQNHEIINIMARMRILIKNEFGVLLPLKNNNSVKTYCYYGYKSNQSELTQLSQELLKLTNKPGSQDGLSNHIDKDEPADNSNDIIIADHIDSHTHDTGHINDEKIDLRSINHCPESSIYRNNFLELLASNFINKPIQIIHPSIDMLVINKPFKIVYTSSRLNDLFLSNILKSNPINYRDVDTAELSKLDASISIIKLSLFSWSCGIRMSGEHLLSCLQPYPAFRFTKWPDFFMRPEHTKIAIALSRKPYSVNGLMETLGITKEASISFLNAAYLCGSLEGLNAETNAIESASPVDNTRPARLGIISRIREKLRNLS